MVDPELQQFATRWQTLLKGDSVPPVALDKEAAKFGFHADLFDSLKQALQALPELADVAAWQGLLAGLDAPWAIGNGLCTVWQRATSRPGTAPTESERTWLLAALGRLEALAKPLGRLATLRLTSSLDGYHAPVAADEVMNQVLTLNADGTIRLDSIQGGGTTATEHLVVAPRRLRTALAAAATFFERYQQVPESDCDTWQAVITTEDGRRLGYDGAMGDDPAAIDLAEAIRAAVPHAHLWLFDHDPDRLTRLVIDYREEPAVLEKLVVDAANGVISLTHRDATTRSKQSLQVAGVGQLLDRIAHTAFFTTTYHRPLPGKLHATGRFRYRGVKKVAGTLTLDTQPLGWTAVATLLRAFLAAHDAVTLDPRVYGRHAKKPGDYLYAQVMFHHEGEGYSYRTTDERLAVGDRVLVPVNNTTTIGTIVAMDYFDWQHVPYPLDRTRFIIEKATDEWAPAKAGHDFPIMLNDATIEISYGGPADEDETEDDDDE
ncbi:hypothetical protein [Lacticaseibacillus kribbianus]|uniref:hypothetical protein n=1 Tax=Lacticaseibacillus kribbianus TaxID=2926292 RepID=UPI001CD19CD2|nr:hypothetical protein [Lacticaseibacillus kribbianus]